MIDLEKRLKLEAVKTLKSAMNCHESGKWDEAAELYQWILAVLPENADVWALCGLLNYQRGYSSVAAKMFTKAISVNEHQPIAQNFFKDIAKKEVISKICPDEVTREYVTQNLFEVTESPKCPADEIDNSTKELGQLSSSQAQANLFKCLKLEEEGRALEALALIGEAIELEPDSPYLHFRYGNLLGRLGRWDDAIANLNIVANSNPLYGAVYNDRATIYFKQGKLNEAYTDIEKAVVLLPGSSQVHRNRGYILVKQQKLAEAASSYSRSLSLDPESAETFNNLGMAVEAMGRFDDAAIFYKKASNLDDSLSLAKWNKGLMSLRLGDYQNGWPLFEKRWETEMAGKERSYDFPLWDGQTSVNGKTILIHYEQGLGDVIQFSRYVKEVERLGAKVVLEVQSPLVPILKNLTENVKVIASLEGLAGGLDFGIDMRCPIMSLPALLKTTLSTVPHPSPYIFADKDKVEWWARKLGKKVTPRIGIAWSGRATHNNDHNRTIPLKELKPLFDKDIEFHSLQIDYREYDEKQLSQVNNLFDHSEHLKDFGDTAGLINNLDLIIAVDTSVAHLAGAMGKPVWVLLPSWPDWRWMADRADSPWYQTAKLFRQRYIDHDDPAPWEFVIKKVSQQLTHFISKKLGESQGKTGISHQNNTVKKGGLNELGIEDPELALLLKGLIKTYKASDKVKANKICKSVLKTHPNSPHALAILGSLSFEEGDYESAALLMEKSVSIDAGQPETLNMYGVAKQELGYRKDAIAIFEKLTKLFPEFVDAHINLGNLRYEDKDFSAAKISFDSAISLDPLDADAFYNLGNTLKELGKWDLANTAYEKCIAIDPKYQKAYNNKASVLRQTDRDLEALKNYDEAIRLDEGKTPRLYYERAIVLIQLERQEEAKCDLERFIVASPESADTYQKTAYLLMLLGKHDEARDSLEKSLDLDSSNADAHHTHARLLAKMEEWEGAAKSYSRAITIDPSKAVYYANRGGTYVELGRFKEALDDCNRGLKLYERSPDILMNKAIALDQLDKEQEALTSFDEALALHPKHYLAHFNKSLLSLRLGRLKEGFAGYEYRWNTESFIRYEKTYPYPVWNGQQSLVNKTIFVHGEQGFGDSIQFCRYLDKLVSLSDRVIFGVPPALVGLMSSLKIDCDVVSKGTPVKKIDYRLPLMSLPHIFKTTLETIPSGNPYLFVDKSSRGRWRGIIKDTQKTKVGLVWSGRAKHKNDKNRSLDLKTYMPLLEMNAEFFSIQKEVRDSDRDSFDRMPKLVDYSDRLTDFMQTAALVERLDVVITVDTSVAHVAGAIGKPVWILLPFRPDWRWLNTRDDSPWYPTARLFRQSEDRQWGPVIERVAGELQDLIRDNEG